MWNPVSFIPNAVQSVTRWVLRRNRHFAERRRCRSLRRVRALLLRRSATLLLHRAIISLATMACSRPSTISASPSCALPPPLTAIRLHRRLPWADLPKRVFATDVLVCDTCGSNMRTFAILPAGEASHAIVEHLGPLPSHFRRRAHHQVVRLTRPD